jgi:hypothetical protein
VTAGNLDQMRTQFLDRLTDFQGSLEGYDGFSMYWTQIQSQAERVEEIGQIDSWVRDLARDRDRVAALRSRKREGEGVMGNDELMHILNRLLSLLDEVGGDLRKRLRLLRDRLGMWVFLAGMGKKSKPLPRGAADQDKKDAKAKKKKRTAKKEALAGRRQRTTPSKDPAR